MEASQEKSALKLYSVTLAGGGREKLIGDAIKSVLDVIDGAILVDTGPSAQAAIQVALEMVQAAGKPVFVTRFEPGWAYEAGAKLWSIAEGRNFGLKAAAEVGADWAMIVDTDERIVLNDIDVHAMLADSSFDSLSANSVLRTYCKTRFIRLPAKGAYAGRAHEAYSGASSANINVVTFWELPKTEAEYKERARSCIEELTEAVINEPGNPRWWYYLADSYEIVGEMPSAIEAFRRCSEIKFWDEEQAWACYRAGWCCMRANRLQDAYDFAIKGIGIHPGISELAWLAGIACNKMARHMQAVCWARMCLATADQKYVARSGFRDPDRWGRGPWDILRWSLKGLGDLEGAAHAEREMNRAMEA